MLKTLKKITYIKLSSKIRGFNQMYRHKKGHSDGAAFISKYPEFNFYSNMIIRSEAVPYGLDNT